MKGFIEHLLGSISEVETEMTLENLNESQQGFLDDTDLFQTTQDLDGQQSQNDDIYQDDDTFSDLEDEDQVMFQDLYNDLVDVAADEQNLFESVQDEKEQQKQNSLGIKQDDH